MPLCDTPSGTFCVADDDIGRLLADHVGGARDEESRDAREHGCVNDPQPLCAVHFQIAREDAFVLACPAPRVIRVNQGGSYKTADRYGNLQLTFFASQAAPLTFKVDADIDDAAGVGHTFQVLRNWATHGTTHPYDIHKILVFRQEVALPYDLA